MDLHPVTVHFPIALLVASFIFDLIGVVAKDDSFRKAGLYCLLLGFIGAGAAYFTGVMSESDAAAIPNIRPTLQAHESAGILTLVFFGVLMIVRIVLEGRPLLRRVGYVVYLLLALIAVINILRTGYLGAELVQRFGAGVEPVKRRLEIQRSQTQPPTGLTEKRAPEAASQGPSEPDR